MKTTLTPLLLCSALALAACNAPAPAPTTGETPATPAPAPTPTEPATPPINPAPQMSETGKPDGARDLAKWDGYDELRFGMDDAAFRKAWGGELKKDAPSRGSQCYHVYPAWTKVPAEFAFMFDEGKFVRYSAESDTLVAPGGGKVGMTKGQIAKLYPGRIEEQLHKYTDGQYLRINSPDGGSGVLIFETDGKTDAAKVTEWRVGVPPQVDYVEGCS